MKFKIDENLPQEVCDLLREAGHDALSVVDQQLAGAEDPKVFDVCQEEERILITLDVGFANIRAYPPGSANGILVLRLVQQDKPYVMGVMRRVLPLLARESPKNRLWIVEGNRVRIRG